MEETEMIATGKLNNLPEIINPQSLNIMPILAETFLEERDMHLLDNIPSADLPRICFEMGIAFGMGIMTRKKDPRSAS
jgi:hypothetical protein